MERYKNCQSCGMPLKQDPNGGGTNADGTRSDRYCGYCCVNGRFTQPDMSVDGMKTFVVGKMREMGFPGFLARFFVRNLHRLERWRK